MSGRNYWGIVEKLEFPDQDRFNPTLLSLPFLGSKSNATFVVLARDWSEPEEKGNGKVIDKRTIIASLLHDSFDPSGLHPLTPSKNYHNRCQSLRDLDDLVHSDKDLFPNCNPDTFEKHFMHVSGPEDPRIFWSHLGEPLLIYNSIGAKNSVLCRHMYIVDLRSVYPLLTELLTDIPHVPPIRYSESLPLIYENQTGLQKNWSPFSNAAGELFLHTDLVPQTIYKIPTIGEAPTFSSPAADLSWLEPVVTSTVHANCITLVLEREENVDKGVRIHQATTFLEVILCTSEDVSSGACDPKKPENRLYMSLFHVGLGNMMPAYEPRIVTMSVLEPFEYVSVSKPLTYSMTPDTLIIILMLTYFR
jgi:hypothetical protein